MPPETTNTLGKAIPVFRVASLSTALEHYINVLGFHREWGDAIFASVSRDQCNIFLCEGDQGHIGTWTWIGVNDAAALADELHDKGAKIRHPPTNYPWAYEMQVEDLDGNVLRFGSDPIEDQPWGEWLDMQGRSWPLDPTLKIVPE